jgi:hypothetical protein
MEKGWETRESTAEVRVKFKDARKELLNVAGGVSAADAKCLAVGLGQFIGVPVLTDGDTVLWQPSMVTQS